MNYARKVIVTGLNPSNEAVYLGLMHDGAPLYIKTARGLEAWGSPRTLYSDLNEAHRGLCSPYRYQDSPRHDYWIVEEYP